VSQTGPLRTFLSSSPLSHDPTGVVNRRDAQPFHRATKKFITVGLVATCE
jgi:hypothetical protein